MMILARFEDPFDGIPHALLLAERDRAWVCDMLRAGGAARRTTWRTTSRGGARVGECTHKSIRETTHV